MVLKRPVLVRFLFSPISGPALTECTLAGSARERHRGQVRRYRSDALALPIEQQPRT